jgi:hypothetical protein
MISTERWMEKLVEERRQEEEARNFKAQPILVISEPFVSIFLFLMFS